MSYKKYYVYREKISTDGGETWTYTGNEAPSGNPIGTYSSLEECENPPVQYKWVATGEEGCEGCACDDFAAIASATYKSTNVGTYDGSLYTTKGECMPCGTVDGSTKGGGIQTSLYMCLGQNLTDFTTNVESGCTTHVSGIDLTGGHDMVLPPNITSFPSVFFSGSTDTQITIPNKVVSLPSFAFQKCRYLNTLVIGSGLTSIESNAFYDGVGVVSTIKNIIIYATTPPTVASRGFDGLSNNISIFVPASAIADYKTAPGWADYQNKIYTIQ